MQRLLVALALLPPLVAQTETGRARPQRAELVRLAREVQDDATRPKAERRLIEIGAPAAEYLIEQLREAFADRDQDAIYHASTTLARLGEPAKAALPLLMTHADDDAALRDDLWQAIGDLAPFAHGTELREQIHACPRGGSDTAVLRALSRVDCDPATPSPELISQLEADDVFLREWAAERLGARRATAALPALRRAVRQPKRHRSPGIVVIASGRALRLGSTDHDGAVRLAAARAILAIDDRDQAAVDSLVTLLRRSLDPLERRTAAMALGSFGDGADAAVPALVAALEDADVAVVREAVTSIGIVARSPSRITVHLRAALAHADRQVAARAQAALRQIERAAERDR